MVEPSPAVVEEPGSVSVESSGHLMVVPRTTGPLVDVDAARRRSADELDATIDEVFGETTDARPGRLDVVLVVGGAALSAWAILTAAQGPQLLIGIVLVLLGLALPARSLARVTRRRRDVSRRRRVMGEGFPLDASHPLTQALIEAYDTCLRIAGRPGMPHGAEAADAAHLAMVEVATLLDGGAPIAPADASYVRRRTQAIESVTHQFERKMRRLSQSSHVMLTPDLERATAVALAREELESSTGLGSVDRLAEVQASLELEADDGSR